MSEGVQTLHQLGMAWAVSMGGLEGPDEVPVTKSIKTTVLRLALDKLQPSLLAVVMAVDGRVEDLAATLMQLEATLAGAKPKAIQAAKGQQGGGQEKGEIRVPRKTLWLDLLKAGVPREEINGKPMADLCKWWMQLPPTKRSAGEKGEESRVYEASGALRPAS